MPVKRVRKMLFCLFLYKSVSALPERHCCTTMFVIRIARSISAQTYSIRLHTADINTFTYYYFCSILGVCNVYFRKDFFKRSSVRGLHVLNNGGLCTYLVYPIKY